MPLRPGGADGSDLADLDPFDAAGDGDGLPHGLGEGRAFLACAVLQPLDVEAREVPVPLLR